MCSVSTVHCGPRGQSQCRRYQERTTVSIQIHELRLSCAWFERWGDLWSPGKSIAMQFLREPNGYAREFNQMMSETVKLVQAGKPVPPARLTATALTPPWPYTTPQYRQWFWRYFLWTHPAGPSGG